jgi:hypothetical protein
MILFSFLKFKVFEFDNVIILFGISDFTKGRQNNTTPQISSFCGEIILFLSTINVFS